MPSLAYRGRGQPSSCSVFVGQALLPVLLCCADIERDRQECLSYPKQVRADGDVTPSALVWQYLRAQNAVEELWT